MIFLYFFYVRQIIRISREEGQDVGLLFMFPQKPPICSPRRTNPPPISHPPLPPLPPPSPPFPHTTGISTEICKQIFSNIKFKQKSLYIYLCDVNQFQAISRYPLDSNNLRNTFAYWLSPRLGKRSS